MEKLQEELIKKIEEILPNADDGDAQLLDVLNRLLGTVSSNLIASKH